MFYIFVLHCCVSKTVVKIKHKMKQQKNPLGSTVKWISCCTWRSGTVFKTNLFFKLTTSIFYIAICDANKIFFPSFTLSTPKSYDFIYKTTDVQAGFKILLYHHLMKEVLSKTVSVRWNAARLVCVFFRHSKVPFLPFSTAKGYTEYKILTSRFLFVLKHFLLSHSSNFLWSLGFLL